MTCINNCVDTAIQIVKKYLKKNIWFLAASNCNNIQTTALLKSET